MTIQNKQVLKNTGFRPENGKIFTRSEQMKYIKCAVCNQLTPGYEISQDCETEDICLFCINDIELGTESDENDNLSC